MDINESIVVAPAILVMGVSDPCRMRNTGDPMRNNAQINKRGIDAICLPHWQ